MNDEAYEGRLAALEARFQELEDDRAIRELLARYGYNADCCRDEEYVDLYAADGSLNLFWEGKDEVWQGKDKLRTFITSTGDGHTYGHHRPGYYGRSLHVQGLNMVTHIDGNDAVVDAYSVVFHDKQGDGIAVRVALNEQWTLKKVDGSWLIEERRVRRVGHADFLRNLDATPR